MGNRVRVGATPARHYSGRDLRRDRTLWASLALIGPVHRVFYSGDTGPSEQFAQVGERLGPFDVAIVKIGAYGRTWPDIHVTPEQALAIHHRVGGRVFMPAHWGTYNLAAHSWYEPADRLVAAAADSGRPMRWIETRGQAADHPVLLQVPESGYLKGAVLQAV